MAPIRRGPIFSPSTSAAMRVRNSGSTKKIEIAVASGSSATAQFSEPTAPATNTPASASQPACAPGHASCPRAVRSDIRITLWIPKRNSAICPGVSAAARYLAMASRIGTSITPATMKRMPEVMRSSC